MSAAQVELDPLLVRMFERRRSPPRSTRSPTGTGPRFGSGSSRSARVSARVGPVQLVHNACDVPQAVVKVTRQGRTTGGTALRNQLQYIGRNSEVELQGQMGEVFEPGGNGRYAELAEDWQRDFDLMDRRTGFFTYHLVVSYPRGTARDAAERAAEAFAQELTGGEYGDRWKYALAHHRDTDYPHSHLVLNRRGAEGRTLHISRHAITVQDLRELHVETAGREAIELNATSRASRNVQDRPPSSGRIHAAREGRDLAPRAEPRAQRRESFPFHGPGYRPNIASLTLLQRYAASYEQLAGAMEAVKHRSFVSGIDAEGTGKRLAEAAALLREDEELPDPRSAAKPVPPRSTFERISAEVRERYIGLKESYKGARDEKERSIFPRFAEMTGALLTHADRVLTGIDIDPPPKLNLDGDRPASLRDRGNVDGRKVDERKDGRTDAKYEGRSLDRDDDGIDR